MLAQLGAPPLPVLALNYLDASHPAPPGFYQFGLAPEDEARAAAEDAVSRGLRRALVLVPSNERGVRVQAAFQQRLAELGGRVVDANRYSGEPKDWSDPVAQLLRFKVIEDRKALQELREKAQPGIDPQRRNDFDFIFIDARAGQARVIWPLFRYYHAERMPIYATAAVNEGPGDSDLAGIRFCDAPWALDGAGVWAPLHAEALANGRSLDNARLYALGQDAAQLATRIAQNSLRPGDSVPGATGMLSVDSSGAVHRQLSCAITTVGDPAPLGAPEAATQAP
jgi:outer membrane PBP1 activator LpoA protein